MDTSVVEITISGGAVQDVECPGETRVIIRDYDIEGSDFEGLNIRKDDEGNLYQQMEFESEQDGQAQKESRAEISGTSDSTSVYLKLFHGRSDPNEEMNNWGEAGPIFECEFVHSTYCVDIKTSNYGLDELRFYHDMVYYGGMFYGDWSAFVPDKECRESKDFKSRLQPFDPEEAKLPERLAAAPMSRTEPLAIDMSNVDWVLLRQQKLGLIIVSHLLRESDDMVPDENSDDSTFEGLLSLLDFLQDSAARIIGEEAVFGSDEKPEITQQTDASNDAISELNKRGLEHS